jgi:hypothetical protein
VAEGSQAEGGVVARMSSGLAPDGSAYLHAVAGDLDVMKQVSRTGANTLRLRRGDDSVEFRVDHAGVTVSRGGQSVQLLAETAGETELAAVRVLLAGSRSVRALRLLGTTLGTGAMRSPGGLALVLADAVVGLLDGDVTAVQRLAERLGGRRPAVRLAAAGGGCYETWEGEAVGAWDDYWDCMITHVDSGLWRDLCSFRWVMWAESAWFSFLKCAYSPLSIQ